MTTTSAVRELTTLCKAGRQAYLEAVQRRDEMEAAMIRADALLTAIEAASTEQASAALLRMAHPDAGMVEVVGEGSNRETVRVMAMALFCGFTPGKQEFAIFHGRVKSTLYLKDAGIRKLLVQQGCEPPQVTVGFPQQVQLKTGLTVWAVDGECSTVYDDKTYRVQFSGPGAVKLPCKFFKNSNDSSDNIDGIIAKARRRMLLELMRVVQSAAGMTPEDSNEGDDTTIDARIEVIDAGPAQQQAAGNVSPSSGFDPDGHLRDEAATLRDRFGGAEGELATGWFTELVSAKSVRQLQTSWQAWGRVAKENNIDTEHEIYKFLTRVKDLLKGVHGG